MALIAVIAVTVAAILFFTRSDSGKDSMPAASGIASANDKGPVAVITEDPSCAAWAPVSNNLTDGQENGWTARDPSIPATAWTPEQRGQYDAAGQAMRSAADQSVALAKLTPHRVMRELYEQFIAYARAYADRIPGYTPPDDYLARAANSASSAIGVVCSGIIYGSAAARGPLLPGQAPPRHVAPPGDPAQPQRFLLSADPICPEWASQLSRVNADTTAWQNIPVDIPASQWTPEQKAIMEAVKPVIKAHSDKIEQLGQRSNNPILKDFVDLCVQYLRAYALALPSYVAADGYLSNVNMYSASLIRAACAAVGS